MNRRQADVLVIGYGNLGRLDDGLGPALASALEKLNLPGVAVETAYQLSVEDAATIAQYPVVIFADAAVKGPAPFSFQRVKPKKGKGFTSHRMTPEALLFLARDLFQAKTRGYSLAMRGYEFDAFGERLSERARANLSAALTFIKEVLVKKTFPKAAVQLRSRNSRPNFQRGN